VGREGLLVFFFFFRASAMAAGPLEIATRAAVVDLTTVSLGSLLAEAGSADMVGSIWFGGRVGAF
jgi:hypothetical protein